MNISTHKDLEVWKMGIDLVEKIYKMTNGFPKVEQYGLTTQMRRASISVPSNIAEGYARNSGKELVHFLYIALGSLSELETQLIIAHRLSYTQSQDLFQDIEVIRRMTINLIKFHKNKLKEIIKKKSNNQPNN